MASEMLARLASKRIPKQVESFPEFLGVGVVPSSKNSRDMVVAVYVSKPERLLSKELLSTIPKKTSITLKGKLSSVRVKIVNIGDVRI